MRYKYKKYYRKKRKKRFTFSIFKSCIFWLIFLILALASTFFYFIFISSFFQIKEIQVSGNKETCSKDIRDEVSNSIENQIIFFKTKNIFLANTKKISDIILKDFPQISNASVTKNFFNTLMVRIKEKKSIAIFSQNKNYFLIDKKGRIFKKIKEDGQDFVIEKINADNKLVLGSIVVKEEEIKKILTIKSKMENEFKVPLKNALILNDKRLNIITKQGWEIYFNPKKDIDWQLTELGTILKKEIPADKQKNLKYIDLRFDKVYVFPDFH